MAHRVMEPLEGRLLLSSLPAGFTETNIAKVPTTVSATMAFAPDGRLFVGDTKAGQIRVIKDNKLLPDAAITFAVDRASERGINGIAFAPNFAAAPVGQKYVFVYYTKPDPAKPNVSPSNAKNRLSRFTVSSTNTDKLDPASEQVLLDNISATAGNHNGGTLHFGADGMLYLGVGEAAVPEDAQRLSTYSGKVLRLNAMNPASLIPSDNPFVSTTGALGGIWALGFRNPFTGAIKPGTSTLYINDVGQQSWEEVNNVIKGKNYGWPSTEGSTTNTAYVSPIFSYPHNGSAKAITGGAFYNGSQFPSSYKDKYFFGDFVVKTIWWLDEANKKAVPFATNTLMIVDLDVNPNDGSLWYLDLNGNVQRISYAAGNRVPTAVATASKTSGLAPLAVSFDGSGSTDPDGDALTYSWSFGDGATATGKAVTHTYTTNGQYTATLTVSDGRGGSDASDPIAIQVGNRAPVPKIESPIENSLYNGGQVITFKGSATDPEDGVLTASRFEWSVVFHHDDHTHPFRSSIPGVTSGTFTLPRIGEQDANQWYRIALTVTDSGGLKTTTDIDIKPRKSTFTMATNIGGLKLNLDGSPKSLPLSTVGVVGMTRQLGAPATQALNGKTYEFVSWSDGKVATHSFDILAANTTYTATYREVTASTLRAVADAHVHDGAASQNFGSAAQFAVKKSTAGYNRHAYLRFGLSTVGTVNTAKLRIYGKLDSSTVKNIPIEVFAVTSTTWGESTINWGNKPATGTTPIGKFTLLDSTARYYEVDVTAYVKQQKAAGKTAVTFALKGGVSTPAVALFNSDEATANRPQLVVT